MQGKKRSKVEHLQSKRLSDSIMRQAHRGKPLTEEEKQRNKRL